MTFLKNQTMYQPELATIRQQLHEAIDVLECPPSVALLDHPNHPNVGDSLIWLGEVFYFTQTQGAQVGYMCNRRNFSPHELEKQVGSESPIFLHGGCNFGDVWPFYQKFRENIIERYPDRPIVILPQTIFFKDTDNIAPIARLFNDHGKITIFVETTTATKLQQSIFIIAECSKHPTWPLRWSEYLLQSFYHLCLKHLYIYPGKIKRPTYHVILVTLVSATW